MDPLALLAQRAHKLDMEFWIHLRRRSPYRQEPVRVQAVELFIKYRETES